MSQNTPVADTTQQGGAAAQQPLLRRARTWVGEGRRADTLTTVGGALLLIGLIAYFSIVRPDSFPTWQNAKSILTTMAVVWILGVGLTVVLAINEFDLSFANVTALGGAVTVITIVNTGFPIWLGILCGIGAGLAIGLANGLAVAYGRAPAFIVTLAFSSVAFGLERLISGEEVIAGLPTSFLSITQKSMLGIPNTAVFAIVITAIIYVLLEYSVWGRRIRAIGANRRAAELAGLPVARTRVLAFAITGLIAGIAGVILMSTAAQFYPNSSEGLLLPPFTAAYLGAAAVGRGRFGALSTVYGIIFLGVLQIGLTMLGQPAWLVTLIQGSVLAGAVLLARQFK
jgi:ribose transport system permease protein